MGAQFFDQGEDADNQGSAADHDDADNENGGDAEAEPVPDSEDEAVGAGFQFFLSGERHHYVGAFLSEEVGHGDELIAVFTQLVDNLRQGHDGVGALAAAVVEEDDVAHARLANHVVNNFLRGNLFAIDLAPIVGIDFLADDQVAHILGEGQLRDLFGVLGLMVDAVGRAEEDGFDADGAPDQTLGEIQLPMNFGFGDVVKAGMGVGVIADLVAFGVLALYDLRKLAGVDTDYEESCGNVFLLEDVEDFGGPTEVGAIVEGDGDFVVGRADLVDVVGERIGFVFLGGKEVAGGVVNETA